MSDKLQEFYRHSSASVRTRDIDECAASKIYGEYVHFVAQTAPVPSSLLDVGCGNGWSTALFSRQGYRATGVDLNADFFEPSPRPDLQLQEASVLALPFPDSSFHVVAANQMLEHVPAPATGLAEMLRVLKPGGVICIVGPNLISPLVPLRGILHYVWQNRPLRRIFVRGAQMPRHPGGNTLPEAVVALARNMGRVAQQTLAAAPQFEMREPDLVPPFHADNDACYLCNPFDIVKFVRSRGCQVLTNGKPGRSPFTSAFAAGTWVAARMSKVSV